MRQRGHREPPAMQFTFTTSRIDRDVMCKRLKTTKNEPPFHTFRRLAATEDAP